MFKLLASTAIASLACVSLAFADPVTGAALAISTFLTAQVGATLAAAIISTSLSLIVAGGMALVMGGPKAISQGDLVRELQQPTSLPFYRFAYGAGWVPGTPAPVRTKNGILIACYILNSRPSAGPFTLYLDKRQVEVSGDPYDFAGAGALATNGPFTDHCQYWIGRGDQVGPPALLVTQFPEYFKSTDAWRGRTVLWLRIRIGEEEDRQRRWPSAPPEVMVDGRWSLVKDPRNPSAPAAWSANQALCTLDAIRNNPLRKYDDRHLWLETFAWAADEADAPFPVKGGTTIPKFETNGFLVFREGMEVEDQIIPLADAGAARLIRVGGRLGLIPAVYSEPVMTIDHFYGDAPAVYNRYRPTSELVTEVSAKYVSPERMYEEAETPVYQLAGAQAEDGGDPKLGQYNLRFVTDYRQAEYVAAIMGRRTRMQRSFSGVLPAKAFDLVACSTLMLDFPVPFHRRNGTYEIEKINPGEDMMGLNGFAMRCPALMRETSPAVYAWDSAVDEIDIPTEEFNPNVGTIAPPGVVSTLSNATTVLKSGDTSIPRVRFDFTPSTSENIRHYYWEYKEGAGAWQAGGTIGKDVRDGANKVFGYISPAIIGVSYLIKVWAVTTGTRSQPVTSVAVVASAGAALSPAPTAVSCVRGGTGELVITFRSPNDGDYRYMQVWAGNTNVIGNAAIRWDGVYGVDSAKTFIESGLGVNRTRFYWARSFDRNGQPSAFSPFMTATTI